MTCPWPCVSTCPDTRLWPLGLPPYETLGKLLPTLKWAFCWLRAIVPVPLSLRIPTTVGFRAAGTRGLEPALPGHEGRRRKLRGWRLPSDVPLWKGWQWRDFCQTGSPRGGSLGSQGKIPLMCSKLCPALLLSQASLPQSRAREQLQWPDLALWDL